MFELGLAVYAAGWGYHVAWLQSNLEFTWQKAVAMSFGWPLIWVVGAMMQVTDWFVEKYL